MTEIEWTEVLIHWSFSQSVLREHQHLPHLQQGNTSVREISNSNANLFQFNRKNSRNVPQNLEPRVDVGVVGVHQHCPGPTKCGENQEVSPGVLLDDCSVLIVIIFRGIPLSRCHLGETACVVSCIALGHSGGYCDEGTLGIRQDCKCTD